MDMWGDKPMYGRMKPIFVIFAAAIVVSLAFTGPVTAKESGQTKLIASNLFSGKSILPSGEDKRRLLESVNKILLNLKERLNKYEKLLVNKIGKEKTEKIKSLLDELQEILTEIDKEMEVTSVKEKLTQILYQLRNICRESSSTGKTKTLSSKKIEVVEIPRVESKVQVLVKESDGILLFGFILALIAAILTACTFPISNMIWAIIGAAYWVWGTLVGWGIFGGGGPLILLEAIIVSIVLGAVSGFIGAPLWSFLVVWCWWYQRFGNE